MRCEASLPNSCDTPAASLLNLPWPDHSVVPCYYCELPLITRKLLNSRYSLYSSCNRRFASICWRIRLRRTAIAQSNDKVLALLRFRGERKFRFRLHLKGSHSHSRNFGEASKRPIRMPATATQTLTRVKMSCRDHPARVWSRPVGRWWWLGPTLRVGGIGKALMRVGRRPTPAIRRVYISAACSHVRQEACSI